MKRFYFTTIFTLLLVMSYGQDVQIRFKAMCHKFPEMDDFSEIKPIEGTGTIYENSIVINSNEKTTFFIKSILNLSDDKNECDFRCVDSKGNNAIVMLQFKENNKNNILVILYDNLELMYWFDIN